ncbi:hypothetical protein A6R68_07856 [Neotoma lepida]|uniref:Uncharacterized protein n=1 Tax=Neotoma lepida TaxID=56216 RepID=A0A1A6GBI4_NEOLE|nr:hypothetical protein A6R68_07856 [Neotoma lepida]
MFMSHLISTLDGQEDLHMMFVMLKMLYIIWTENGFVGVKLKYSSHRGIERRQIK